MRALSALAAALTLGLALLFLESASAHWRPEYASAPPEVQAWYRDAEVTPDAQRRLFPNASARIKCCNNADVVKTQFRVDHKTGGDEWWWLDGATWRKIPADIIHWGEHAPGGMPTLFVFQGRETCFFPGEDGN